MPNVYLEWFDCDWFLLFFFPLRSIGLPFNKRFKNRLLKALLQDNIKAKNLFFYFFIYFTEETKTTSGKT